MMIGLRTAAAVAAIAAASLVPFASTSAAPVSVPVQSRAVVKFLFEDESFSFETLRTAGFAVYGGADLGEVLATASDTEG